MELREYNNYNHDKVINLYEQVGWTNYSNNPEMLMKAYQNSLYIVGAYENETLVGIIRTVGDGYSIVFIQDIIVLPEFQHQGIGAMLIKEVMKRFSSVYQMELLTDNTRKTVNFYKFVRFMPAEECGCFSFIKMRQN